MVLYVCFYFLKYFRSPLSSMVFGTNALFTKPAQSLAPMLVVTILNQFGYENLNNEVAQPDPRWVQKGCFKSQNLEWNNPVIQTVNGKLIYHQFASTVLQKYEHFKHFSFAFFLCIEIKRFLDFFKRNKSFIKQYI